MKTSLRIATLGTALLVAGSAMPAHAVNKDMVQLQTQIQQLQDAVARLQQSNDERMGVLKDLVQQTADSVNRMTASVNSLKQQMQNTTEASAARNDQLAGQIQSLNDSLDELKARMMRMEKSLGDIQSQQQQSNAILQSMPGATGGGSATPAGPATPPPAADNSPAAGSAIPMPADNGSKAPAVKTAPVAGPSSGQLYRGAYSDYMSGKTNLAAGEFQDLIKAYPDDNLSGNAYFYLGEMNLRGNKPSSAIKDYDKVLEQYPNNAKIPAAHLHKAEALTAMGQRDAATRELKALVQRFPSSPEAAQAKQKLARGR
ncbi:tetratricopeptide repeat protein [Granulicella cerasi]|uniref:Tetratricopeptide repeat protein n=1 Tax=Granulicella cerasi TaxID=741063 RepID=A0ABW1Z4Y7_9BACT|nr:tetratricopeptide repeat protein [Granulicella cerasi]